MDPAVNIQEQVALAQQLLSKFDLVDFVEDVAIDLDDVSRLCELVLALDQWQRRGGHSPYQALKKA